MASTTLFYLVFVTVAVFNCFGSGTAIHVETVPKSFNELITRELNVTCFADGPAYWAKSVFALQLGKKGQQPMAVYNCLELTKGPTIKTNIQAEGKIEKGERRSFLRLTITDPGLEDTGEYSCVVYYLDEFFQMKKKTAESKVTVENDNMKEVVKHLLDKVSSLENVISSQQNITNDQLVHLETVTVDQGRQLQQQDNQIKELSSKQNTKSAFLVGHSDGVLTKGQVLKFQNVKENIGNNFNKDTGIYTAPVDGLYAFHLYGMSYKTSGRKEIHIQMMAKNQIAATLLVEHTDFYDQSSVSSVLHLKAGQTVHCVVNSVSNSDNRLHPFPYSGFTGHLIQAL